MDRTVNQLLDVISSIRPDKLEEYPELINLKKKLISMKTSETYKGYGGKVMIVLSKKLSDLIESLIN